MTFTDSHMPRNGPHAIPIIYKSYNDNAQLTTSLEYWNKGTERQNLHNVYECKFGMSGSINNFKQ